MISQFILTPSVKDFMRVFKKNSYQIYIVGGAIRDLILKRTINNWDFSTNAKPEQIIKLFPRTFYNNNFGTVTIPSSNYIFEITPFRKESNYKDLRHPNKITWAKTIEEDLARRDFTINAIAFDGQKILDPFKGRQHIKEKIIVSVGNPDVRFNEDALRLIRAIRIATELQFFIEEQTRMSIVKNSHLINKISKERIRDELFKILKSDYPAEGILFLKNTGLLRFVIPELDRAFSIPQKSPKRHHIYDVGTHLIMSLKASPSKDPIVRLAILLHDIGKPETFRKDLKTELITFHNHEIIGAKIVKKIANDLRLSNAENDRLYLLIRHHQFTVSELQTDRAIRRFIREIGKENIEDILSLRKADRIGSGAKPTSWRFELFKKRLITVQKQPFKISDLKINGDDVMKILGLKPGPSVGKILQNVFDKVINKEVKNERIFLLKIIHELKKE